MFKDGGVPRCSCYAVRRRGHFTTSFATTGTHNITVAFTHDVAADYNNSTSAVLQQFVADGNSSVALSSSSTLNTSVFGESVTITAAVAAIAPATGTPTGTVTFLDNGVPIAISGLNGSGQATYISSALTVASHPLTAIYNGDVDFTSSTSGILTQVVTTAATTTTVALLPISSVVGQSVTLTATIAVTLPGGGIPTGTVTFRDGVIVLGTGTLSGAVATVSTTALTQGAHNNITATYAGDADFGGSTSAAAAAFAVSQDTTTTTLVSSLNPSLINQNMTFTATVAAAAPGTGTPTGTVTFLDGATTLGTGTLAAGGATFSTSTLTLGSHNITAVYGGDPNYVTSTSGILAQVINAPVAPTIVALSPPQTPVGSNAMNVLVNGTNFAAGATVNFGGLSRPTTFVSATLVIVALPASDLSAAGVAPITVTNPAPGLATSAAANFTVANLTPVVVNMTPNVATSGDPALNISITGTGFLSTSTVQFSGVSIPTTFVSSTLLTSVIPAASLATAGTVAVTVVNPTPGGGTSNAVSFSVEAFTVNSPPTATPNPAKVGQQVAFTVAASESNNGSPAFAWDFGDTTAGTGANPTHTYTAVGTYTATVTITATTGAKIKATVNVVVVTPDIGGGGLPPGTFVDTTGSGIPDEIATAAASVGITTTSSSKALPNVKLSIKLSFAKPGIDQITLGATLDKTGAGKPIVIDVGGVVKAFKLDSKGRAKAGGDSVTLSLTTGKLTVRFTHGSFATLLASSGLTNTTISGQSLSVRVGVIYNDATWTVSQPQLYKATQGKTGATK